MSRTAWKQREREAAKLIGGRRHWANTGELVDCESDGLVCQVKERKTLSLAAAEALALEIERVASYRAKQGIVMVKRSAGRGRPTPWLVIMTAGTFREFHGPLPVDPAHEEEAACLSPA
jgi:hypothetical protein